MTKFKGSQILMLSLIAALLLVTPLISSSLRPKYLYFVTNLLIVGLGAEAGLLSIFSKPSDERTDSVSLVTSPQSSSPDEAKTVPEKSTFPAASTEKKAKLVEKSASEKIMTSTSSAMKVAEVRKCSSMPSLFFVGNDEAEDEQHEDEQEEEVGGLSGQELFTKSEMFIGNFYDQLKMQREESWKRIHGFYHKAF